MSRALLTDTCCVDGCTSPRRRSGGGRSRFCQTHHHEHYTKRHPEKMQRKRDNERARQARLRAQAD